MDELVNGGPKRLPAIGVGWDANTHTVEFQFDTDQFKTWDFILTILEMAKLKALDMKRVSQAQAMQQQAMQAQQQGILINKLRGH